MPKIQSFTPVHAKSHTPPYKIHRYFARRPWNLFEALVNHYAKPGDIILDPFAGGGVTPYEAVKNSVKVVACDLNPLSNYIVRNMFHSAPSSQLDQAFNDIYTYTHDLNHWSFSVNCPHCQTPNTGAWFELAQTVSCDLCDSHITLIEANKLRNGVYMCPNSRCENHKSGLKVAHIKRNQPVYLSVNGKCAACNKTYSVDVDQNKIESIKDETARLEKQVKLQKAWLPDEIIPLYWDRQKEDLLSEKGFLRFQDLFTNKNLQTNYLVLKKIKQYKNQSEIYEILRFVFSNSLRDTNSMTFTNPTWQNGTPNSWAKHAYWLPATFCEVNISYALQKSYLSIKKSLEFNQKNKIDARFAQNFNQLGRGKNILLKTGTLAEANIPDNSIDAIVTDPPYGSNVQYLELSRFWHMWNQDLYEKAKTGYKNEAVVNRKTVTPESKTYQVYENNLHNVFKDCNRVLKPGGLMVMTFNNKDINTWLALLISIFRSGFHFEKGGISFQDGVSHYKHTAHTKAKSSTYGDFLYEFTKDGQQKSTAAQHINREELAQHISSRIDIAVERYKNGTDRNQVLIDLFNEIVPEIEQFVRYTGKNNTEQARDLYSIFSKSGLEPLYA